MPRINNGKKDPVDVYVGGKVRAARLLFGSSQEATAKECGLTFQQIQKYEKGSNRISASRLLQLAKIFGKPIEWFFEGAPGYKGGEGNDVGAVFFQLPYAVELAESFVAIEHNLDRRVVVDVATALARKAG